MDIVIFDTEIKHGIATENNPRHEDYIYANGWDDFSGMGIACVCAYDIKEARPHVFLEDNLHRFAELVEERGTAMGFNSHRFDGPLLAANGMGSDDIVVLEKEVRRLQRIAAEWAARLHELAEERLPAAYSELPPLSQFTFDACKAWAEASTRLAAAQQKGPAA